MKITEALAEVKTIQKRIESKRAFVLAYLTRDSRLRDPLEKDGGSQKVVEQELQGIGDLEERLVVIRASILQANLNTKLTIGDTTRSVFNWLTWRRELAQNHQNFLRATTAKLAQARTNNAAATAQQGSVVEPIASNINERQHGTNMETLAKILGELDGQLSMINATVDIDLPR